MNKAPKKIHKHQPKHPQRKLTTKPPKKPTVQNQSKFTPPSLPVPLPTTQLTPSYNTSHAYSTSHKSMPKLKSKSSIPSSFTPASPAHATIFTTQSHSHTHPPRHAPLPLPQQDSFRFPTPFSFNTLSALSLPTTLANLKNIPPIYQLNPLNTPFTPHWPRRKPSPLPGDEDPGEYDYPDARGIYPRELLPPVEVELSDDEPKGQVAGNNSGINREAKKGEKELDAPREKEGIAIPEAV